MTLILPYCALIASTLLAFQKHIKPLFILPLFLGAGWLFMEATPQESLNLNVFHIPGLELQFGMDMLSKIMMAFVLLIGSIIFKFAFTYMRSERTRPRFLGQLSLIILAVSLLVTAQNLITAFVGWQLIGLSVYITLNHYHNDIYANKAAKKKFVINRLGDACFLAAVLLCLEKFGTTDYATLKTMAVPPMIPGLIFVAIMTKSAQFPFHIWLPDTMEAPTPLSALMHAGVINSGGFLLMRLAEFYTQSNALMMIVFAVGLLTTVLGGLFMTHQPDVKRRLAYSTISQMGYMILQCGVGSFVGAFFHLMTHGFYKAYLFLNAGNTLKKKATAPFPLSATALLSCFFASIGGLFLLYSFAEFIGLSLPLLIWSTLFLTFYMLTKNMLKQNSSLLFKGGSLALIYGAGALYLYILNFLDDLLLTHDMTGFHFEDLQILLFIPLVLGMLFLDLYAADTPLSMPPTLKRALHQKFYIESFFRKAFLLPIRWLGALLNKKGSNPFLQFTPEASLIIIGGAFINLQEGSDVVPYILFILILLALTLIRANRAPTLDQCLTGLMLFDLGLLPLILYADQKAFLEPLVFHMMNVIPLCGLILNIKHRRAALFTETRHTSGENKLSWHKMYISISVLLVMGIPGSANFITQANLFKNILAIHPLLGALYGLNMILLAICILHCLQLYVFQKQGPDYPQKRFPAFVHVLFGAIIALNIYNGLHPISLLSHF